MAAETQTPIVSPDWAGLPTVVVQGISEKIKSITDFVRFRAVCPSWRSASLARPSHLPPQIPWLMIPYNPNKSKNPNDDAIRLFYDLAQSKMHKIYLPETREMMCCATSEGWLLLVAEEGTDVFLLNPLTRAKITLPNFITHVNVFAHEGATYEAHYWFVPYIGNFVITKVVFSSDPTEPGCIVTVFLQKTCRLFFCRVGDPCWTLVNMEPEQIRTEMPSDGTFFNDKLYVLAHDEKLRIYDLNNPNKHLCCSFEAVFEGSTKYFLQSKSGVFLTMHGFRARNNAQQQGVAEHSSDEDEQEDPEEKSDDEEDKQEDQEEKSDEEEDKQEDQEEKSVDVGKEEDPEEKTSEEDKQEDQEEKSDEEEDKQEDQEEKSVDVGKEEDPEEKTSEEDKQENQEEKTGVEDKEGDEEEKSDEEDKEENLEEKSDEEDKKEDEEEKTGEEDKQENQDAKSIVGKKAIEIYQMLEPEHRLKPMKDMSNMTIFYSDGDVNNYLAVDTKDWDCLKGDSVYMAFPCNPSKKNKMEEEEEDEKVVPCYGIFLASLEEGVGAKIVGDLGERPKLWPPAPALWFQPRFA